MLRFLNRLQQQGLQIAHSSVKYSSFGAIRPKNLQIKQRPIYKDNEKQWQNLMQYYKTSNRHKFFQAESKVLYQFDDETKKITLFEEVHLEQDFDWNQKITNLSNSELICAFESLLNHCRTNNVSLSDEQFDGFIDGFVQRLENFTLNEVIEVLQSFARYPLDRIQVRQRNWIELFQAIDQACTIKAVDLLPAQLLFISSIWLSIPLAKKSWFTVLVSRLLHRYLKEITAPEMAQALFFINCMAQPIEDIRAFENIFEKNIDDLSVEEFSTVLWTFIRLETKIEKQELKNKFFDYIEKQDFSQLEDPYFKKILIITSRLTVPSLTRSAQWAKISQNLRASIEKRSLKTCILLANVGLPTRYFDKETIMHVLNRCLSHPDELQDLSMADLEYLSRILTMSNFENQEIITKVGQNLLTELISRLDNVASRGFYTNFINIVRNLTMIDVYDLELMENIFRKDFIKFIHKQSRQIDMPMYEIDGYNRINLKGIYKGDVLQPSYLSKLCFLIEWVPDKENNKKQDEFPHSIRDAVQKQFTHCQYAHAIPHRRHADLFVCIDKNTSEPVDISKNFPPLYTGHIIEANTLTLNDPNLMVFAIIASNAKEYIVDKRNKCENIPIGFMNQKMKQLKLLGFHPVLVPIHLWKEDDSDIMLQNFIVAEVNKQLAAIGVKNQINLRENKTS